MRNATRPSGALVGGVILIYASVAMAQDWPQWRGANRDGKASGFVAPQTWPKELTQKWKVNVGLGDATPALVGDKLYVFARQDADEVIRCLNASDAKELWATKYPVQAITGPDAREHAGPRSSPTVADGKVVTLGVSGILTCVDAANGKILWKNDEFKGVPRFHTSTSPIIVDGMVIAQLGGQGNGGIIAFDLASGTQKWKWMAEGPGYASPVVMVVDGTKQIVTLAEKSAVGVAAADGKLCWQFAFAPQGMSYNAATPIVDGQTVIITGQGRGTKALSITQAGDAFAAKELWSNPQVATQFSTPVLKDGMLFAVSDRGNLFCINAKTGQTAWTDATNRGRGYGAMVDAGSVILALPNNSELVVFKPADKFEEVAKFKVADKATYAYPVVTGNKVFVKDADSLTLLTIE